MEPDLCVLCGVEGRVPFVVRDEKRVYMAACALCLITAFDQLTGYNFTAMYHHTEALRRVHGAKRRQNLGTDTRPQKGESFASVLAEDGEGQ